MKKRSKYRPKPQLPDPLGWVLGGLKPFATVTREALRLGNLNHGALTAVMACTIDLIDKALRMVRRDIQLKRSKPLYFPQGVTA